MMLPVTSRNPVKFDRLKQNIGTYKAVVGIGVDDGEETGIICDFD